MNYFIKLSLLLIISVVCQDCERKCVCTIHAIICNDIIHEPTFKFIRKRNVQSIFFSNSLIGDFNFIENFPNLKYINMRNSIYSNCTQLDYIRKLFPKVHIANNDCLKMGVDIETVDHFITISSMDINYITEMDKKNNQEATTSGIYGANTTNINGNTTHIKTGGMVKNIVLGCITLLIISIVTLLATSIYLRRKRRRSGFDIEMREIYLQATAV